MKNFMPEIPSHGVGHKWRYRRRERAGTAPLRDPLEHAKELLVAAEPALQHNNLSPNARLLYNTLHNCDEYVICIDPLSTAAAIGVSEPKLRSCLNELRRAGVISTWIGNLVFFDGWEA